MPRRSASLASRAATFAVYAGAVTFVLAILATIQGGLTSGDLKLTLIPAIACAALSWASAQRRIAETAAAIDAAVARLSAAAGGDLTTRVPSAIAREVPELARSMQALFAQLSEKIGRVEHLALYDPVTGLANRARFRHVAETLLAASGDGAQARAALLFIDLDRFKRVNDTRGHAAGDQLLAEVAARLLAQAPAGALVGRLAGDEFTILTPHLGAAEAQALATRIVEVLAAPFHVPGGPVTIGASIGIATAPEHGVTLHELMRAADGAMYHAKDMGRGRVAHFDAAMADAIVRREGLDRDLALALERGEFALAFQPQLSSDGGTLIAAEALLRWRHPTAGVRHPAEFLARAEESGQMVAIGLWVVRAVAEAAARWENERRPGRIALNLGRRELEEPGFVRALGAAMAGAHAPMSRLEIEIAETLAMTCAAETVAALAELRAAGATIAIDDFGSGRSGVQQLRTLPIDRVKLDPVLIRDIATDAASRTIVQALIGLVHGLGCEAVAEGVESVDQAEVLRVIGCDAVQGYAIARPMDDAALARWTQALVTPARRTG